MLIARIIFTFIALIFMIVTFVMYINIKKMLKSPKRISKKELEKKTKKFNIMIIVSILLSIIAIVITIVENSTEIKENTNINTNNYEMYIKKYKEDDDINTTLEYFPQTISDLDVVEFSEYNKNGLFANSYFVLLKCQYTKYNLEKELDKIKSMSIESIEDNQNPYYVYFISDENNVKEYILIDKNNNQIIYIFNQYFNKKDVKDLSKYFIE